jgi:hypothetical protein
LQDSINRADCSSSEIRTDHRANARHNDSGSAGDFASQSQGG